MRGLMLVHDVLDAQLVDRRCDKIGRVDELLLELRDGRPPRVATIVIGGEARARRVGRWMTALHRAVGSITRRPVQGMSRISFDDVRSIADTIELDVDGETLASGHLERWMRDSVVRRIPGGSGDHK
ncbi:MAG: hypothetical protein H0W68_02705 [Gemmatimonadaceae bacterium]|nr:hypothetical protein [Gemmatimonadaceae bacterium]